MNISLLLLRTNLLDPFHRCRISYTQRLGNLSVLVSYSCFDKSSCKLNGLKMMEQSIIKGAGLKGT